MLACRGAYGKDCISVKRRANVSIYLKALLCCSAASHRAIIDVRDLNVLLNGIKSKSQCVLAFGTLLLPSDEVLDCTQPDQNLHNAPFKNPNSFNFCSLQSHLPPLRFSLSHDVPFWRCSFICTLLEHSWFPWGRLFRAAPPRLQDLLEPHVRV